MILHLATLCTAGLVLSAPAPVAHVGPLAIEVNDITTRLGQPKASREAVRKALGAEVTLRALALEAPAVLGEPARTLGVQARAEALLAHLFNPNRVCERIPEGAMRQRYTETRWRFVAPPAWRVDDVQVLCCTHPKRCDQPEVLTCLEGRRALADAVRAELTDTATVKALRERVKSMRADGWSVQTHRYTFFHDPAAPGAPMDWRLQDVDLPIAEAVAALTPGEISDVVTTRFGHHILRLDRTLPAINLPFEDPRTEAMLRTELCPAHLLQQRARYISDLVAQSPITTREEALDALTLRVPPQATPESRSDP